jgi:hypothetical protein
MKFTSFVESGAGMIRIETSSKEGRKFAATTCPVKVDMLSYWKFPFFLGSKPSITLTP